MKCSALLPLLMAGILISGCSSHKPKAAKPVPMAASVIITPDASLAGKVVSYSEVGRYAVLSFPIGQMPKADQRCFLYRGGLKTGEVKITGSQRDNFIVADLITGNAQPGDEVRDQ
jgi:hypothetical protein